MSAVRFGIDFVSIMGVVAYNTVLVSKKCGKSIILDLGIGFDGETANTYSGSCSRGGVSAFCLSGCDDAGIDGCGL